MDTTAILADIDAELKRLREARAAIAAIAGLGPPRGRPKGSTTKASESSKKKRVLTPEGRARIAAAQKARWAATANKG